jgi:beta-glucanase (GH16 family)
MIMFLKTALYTAISIFIIQLTLPNLFFPRDFTPPAGMNLTWSDEFNGPGIDLGNWTYETKARGWSQEWNKEYQDYTDNGTNGPNAFISNGCLVVKAVRVNKLNDYNSYRSARLSTYKLHSWKYGFIAARIRMPYGNGLWPAFWMVGTNLKDEGWPACGEIDIAEMMAGPMNEDRGGGDSSVSAALHSPKDYGFQANQLFYTITNGRLCDDFHVYSVLWKPGEIVFSFDDLPFLKVTKKDVKQWAFDHHFYLLLNLAVGGTWPGYPDKTTVFPQTMTVDWVRVYQ